MIVPGISSMATNSIVRGQTESNSSQAESNNSPGWKYVTVTEGDIIYTYIVIGKNMKVLIGKSSAKENDMDKKNVDDKPEANGNSNKLNAKPQKDCSKQLEAEKVSFLSDYRMLGLTGYYQKKIQETMTNMENHIGFDKANSVGTSAFFARNIDK